MKSKKEEIILKEMPLHSEKQVLAGTSSYYTVLRVLGGWIYSQYNTETDTVSTSSFVPETR